MEESNTPSPPLILGYSPWELCKSKHFINGGIPGINAYEVAVYNSYTLQFRLISEGTADPTKWTHICFPILSYNKKIKNSPETTRAICEIKSCEESEYLHGVYHLDFQSTHLFCKKHFNELYLNLRRDDNRVMLMVQ